MTTYITICYEHSWVEAAICTARRFTDEEKVGLAEWFRDRGFVGLGDSVSLKMLKREDMPARKSDGSFLGTNNEAWIISEAESDALIALNAEREKAEREKVIRSEIEWLEKVVETAERQADIPTRAVAIARRRDWNDMHNEGGEGYIPVIIDREQYEASLERLAEIRNH